MCGMSSGIPIDKTISEILILLLVLTIITHLPFIIAHLAYLINTQPSSCLDALEKKSEFSLISWLFADVGQKISILIFIIVVNITNCYCGGRPESIGILIVCSMFMSLFFLFQLIWLLYGIVNFVKFIEPYEHICTDSLFAYLRTFFTITILLIIFHFAASFLKPRYFEEEMYEEGWIERR